MPQKTVTLNWDHHTGVEGYEIDVLKNGQHHDTIAFMTNSQTCETWEAETGHQYHFRIFGVNEAVRLGSYTEIGLFVADDPVPPVTGFQASY